MSSPAEQHVAVLAGLAALANLAAECTPDPWLDLDLRRIKVGHRDGTPLACPPVLALHSDVTLAVSLRNSLAAVLRGRRRIIERHAPLDYAEPIGAVCSSPDHAGAGPMFPCDEYLDAAADLYGREEPPHAR